MRRKIMFAVFMMVGFCSLSVNAASLRPLATTASKRLLSTRRCCCRKSFPPDDQRPFNKKYPLSTAILSGPALMFFFCWLAEPGDHRNEEWTGNSYG